MELRSKGVASMNAAAIHEVIRQIRALEAENADAKAALGEAVKNETRVLDENAALKTELERWHGDYPAIWQYEERLLARAEKAKAENAALKADVKFWKECNAGSVYASEQWQEKAEKAEAEANPLLDSILIRDEEIRALKDELERIRKGGWEQQERAVKAEIENAALKARVAELEAELSIYAPPEVRDRLLAKKEASRP
jgi:chromosome segregation ATPase